MRRLADAPYELQGPIQEFFPAGEWDNAASISWLESGWQWNAVNDTTDSTHPCGAPLPSKAGVEVSAERSLGFFQINSCNFPGWNACSLWNARQNVGTAHALWEAAGSWSPWYFSAKALGLI